MPMRLKVAPLTPDRWPDLERIFNAKGCSLAAAVAGFYR
jgi:hypothetical protein